MWATDCRHLRRPGQAHSFAQAYENGQNNADDDAARTGIELVANQCVPVRTRAYQRVPVRFSSCPGCVCVFPPPVSGTCESAILRTQT